MAVTDNDINAVREERIFIFREVCTIWHFLIKKWWIFLIVGIIAGLAGIFYASTKKVNFRSRLTFALDEGNGGGVGNILNLASQFGFNMGSGKDIFAGDNILDIMKSRRMLEGVFLSVDTFSNKPYTFIEYYLEISGQRENNTKIKDIHFPVGKQRETFSYSQDSLLFSTAMNFSKNNIVAQRPDRKLSIYEVRVMSPDERFTRDFTSKMVSKTNDFYVEIKTKKAKETLDILEERVASMRGNLSSSLESRAKIQDVNVNPAFSAAEVPVLKQQANIQAYGGAYGEMFKNLELARFQYLNQIPLMQIIDPAAYPMEKIKTGKLKSAILFAFFAEVLLLLLLGIRWAFRN
ncbi:MAG: hypothetical protein ABIO82_05415 [Ginsengibacter sp.]